MMFLGHKRGYCKCDQCNSPIEEEKEMDCYALQGLKEVIGWTDQSDHKKIIAKLTEAVMTLIDEVKELKGRVCDLEPGNR